MIKHLYRSWLICFFFLPFFFAKAQEGYSVYNSYLFDNYYSIHPSIAGLSRCSKLRLMTKYQWAGTGTDTPSVLSISYQGKVSKRVGVGGLIFQDENGPTHQTGIHLSYAYNVPLAGGYFFSDKESLLSLALTYQGFYKNIKTSDFKGGDPNDPVLTSPYKHLFHNVNFSVTLIYNEVFASFTANSLLPYKNTFENNINSIQNFRNYFLTAGFLTSFSDYVAFEPSVTFFYYEKIPKKHLDINAKFYYELNELEPSLTLGYRALLDEGFDSNLLSFVFSTKLKRWSFGYSFDLEIGRIRRYYAPSHKFVFGVNLFCGAFERGYSCKYVY